MREHLDALQIELYRDNWNRSVAASRSTVGDDGPPPDNDPLDPELATTIVEIHREGGSWVSLAWFYDFIENPELRDKAVEKAIADGVSDEVLILLRRMQGRIRDVPAEKLASELARLDEASSFRQSARIYEDLVTIRKPARLI